jgi:DNA-directed RNA polymerase subunit RPC12/RpoP
MSKLIAAKCQSCGKESHVEWSLGARCPSCGSEKFYPVIHVERDRPAKEKKTRTSSSRKPIGAILAILLIAGAVTFLIVSARSTLKKKQFDTTITMICTNPDCGKTFRQKMLTRDAFVPQIACRYCKQKTALRAVQCRNCSTIFPLEPDGWPEQNPVRGLKCPRCGSTDINLDSTSVPLKQSTEE